MGVLLQSAIVLADVGIEDGTGRDEQSAHGVVQVLHLLEHGFQIDVALFFTLGRQLQCAHAVFLGGLLYALINQVVIRTVAQAIRTVNHHHQRCGGRLFLVGVRLVDGAALFSTARQQQ